MGGLQAKSMTSQRYRVTYKMADMRYYGNVMTTTRWRLYVILHLQQYSRRLNFCNFFFPERSDGRPGPLGLLYESTRVYFPWVKRPRAVGTFIYLGPSGKKRVPNLQSRPSILFKIHGPYVSDAVCKPSFNTQEHNLTYF